LTNSLSRLAFESTMLPHYTNICSAWPMVSYRHDDAEWKYFDRWWRIRKQRFPPTQS
jgi:hypothetical protein